MDTKTSDNRSVLATLLVLLQCTLYGLGDPLAKLAYTHVPVYSFLSIRYFFALAVMWAVFPKRMVTGLRNCRLSLVAIPCLCVAGSHLFSNMALQYTSATAVGFLRSLSVVLTPLLGWALYRKRLSWAELAVVAVAVAGLYLLCGYGGLSGFGPGELLALGCAAFSAGGVISLRRSLQQVDPLVMTMCQTAASALIAVAVAVFSDGGIRMAGAVPSVWWSMIYLALGCTFGGYMLQNLALRTISAKTVSLLMCFCSVMTAVFSYLILHERLSAAGLVGAAMILAGVVSESVLSRRQERKPEAEPAWHKTCAG